MSKGFDILLLGDSLVKLGVMPSLVQSETGLKTLNLAIPGSTSAGAYYTFRRALDSGARPAAVVVDFGPGLLEASPAQSEPYWAKVLSFTERAELAFAAGDYDLLLKTQLYASLRSLGARNAIRRGILFALRAIPDSRRLDIEALERNLTVNHGAVALDSVVASTDRELGASEEDQPTLTVVAWKPRPLNAGYIDRLFDLAKRRGVRVYWLLPPVKPALRPNRGHSVNQKSYEAFARAVQRRHPEVIVLDARFGGVPAERFHDATHVDSDGAVMLSEAVARALAAQPANARWMNLKMSPPTAHEVENLAQSRALVNDSTLRR